MPSSVFTKLKALTFLLPFAVSIEARTGTIQDVEHVVLFMQENRAFDHYFGSMAGVRGFADPNVHIAQNGRPIWFQPVSPTVTNATTDLLPFYINGAGENISLATQCMTAGSNSFAANHNAFAQGDNNQWVVKNRILEDIIYARIYLPTLLLPTVGQSQICTLREWLPVPILTEHHFGQVVLSTFLEVPRQSQGGVVIDNNVTPGCEGTNLNCYPYAWKTYAEFLEDGGISWQVYQGTDNFDDNPFTFFQQFQTAAANSSLAKRGVSFLGLQAFYDAAAAGTLPNVTYIIGPKELSEHPPWTPLDGGWLQQQVTNAVINSTLYNSTVLFISYDETGGFGDHVLPIFAPKDTPGEWLTNPSNASQTVFAGPGFRLPFTAISPWSRGGHVFTAYSDHSSQIKFMEQWLTAKGKPIVTDQLNSWRRDHVSDLTQMFDFAHPDFSLPNLPVPTPPLTNAKGQFTGSATCQANFSNPQPPIPYGNQTRQNSLDIEDGFKSVRGALTEGRYLVFESNGLALSFSLVLNGLGFANATAQHDIDTQRFILHATMPPPATTFNLQFAGSPSRGFVDNNILETTSASNAAIFNITDLGNGQGYTINQTSGGSLSVLLGEISNMTQTPTFNVFSVTKSTDSGTGF
ncbi:hypothetical protein M422DRAFT_781472 [Sphaerobolus stellatus SS14]|uniref:Phospholipase C n=1 Tax=Sphaerobolus stellatus (strain SS14) TaxID=990650 RepID=A0A0C9VLG4_SPHS4|nr:hypothetical protein M422DRAFT_781472 [Sphaerobolus stellatus SS14]